MKLFNKKRRGTYGTVEARFDTMMDMIKDLSRADYNRLKKAMDLGWQSYQAIQNVKTEDEREVADIDDIEKKLIKTPKK